MLMILILILTVSSIIVETSITSNNALNRTSFGIDFENNQFLLDGRPFRYVSGSFHYFRTPRQYWRDRLRKIRAAGLNAVSTYVEWSLHQPEIDKWVWNGDADIVEFIKLAQEEDLLVLLRPGPYICAERDFGGFPYWLLNKVPDIKLRTSDIRYLKYAEKYLHELLKRVKPFFRGRGGPIIMVQVENEYGSFYACDSIYKSRLRDLMHSFVQNDALLYTTDGSSRKALECGSIPDVYATIDFGTASNVTENFKIMRKFEKKGPLVNSEFYPGWLSHWQEPFQRVDTSSVVKVLDEMLAIGASVNLYMFYGGTNFAFTSGANIIGNYTPDLTSYDYDAPLTEAGDPTPKYFAIRKTVSKYLQLPEIPTPTESLKRDYGTISMRPVLRLFDPQARRWFGTVRLQSQEPPTFEALNLSQWLVLYEASIPKSNYSETSILHAIPKDRAEIYLNGRFVGRLSRSQCRRTIPLQVSYPGEIKLLVENQGRVNFGNIDVEDFKGIFNVTLDNVKISPWDVTGFRFNTVSDTLLESLPTRNEETGMLFGGPQILFGHFNVTGELLDTYLNTTGWGKGVAFINGHNLGRYWPLEGPQMTLYVPAPYFRQGRNTLLLVELEYVPKQSTINFQTNPVLDYLS